MTCSKGPQVESNPGPLRRGHSLCIWGACSTHWATGRPMNVVFQWSTSLEMDWFLITGFSSVIINQNYWFVRRWQKWKTGRSGCKSILDYVTQTPQSTNPVIVKYRKLTIYTCKKLKCKIWQSKQRRKPKSKDKQRAYSDPLIPVVDPDVVSLPRDGGLRMAPGGDTLHDCRLTCRYHHITGRLTEVISQDWKKQRSYRYMVRLHVHFFIDDTIIYLIYLDSGSPNFLLHFICWRNFPLLIWHLKNHVSFVLTFDL